MNSHPIDHAAASFKILQGTVRELLIPCIIVLPIFFYFFEPSRMLTLEFAVGLIPYAIHWLVRKPEQYIKQLVKYREHRQNLLRVD